MRISMAAILVGGTGVASAQPAPPSLEARAAFVEAINQRNVEGVASAVGLPLRVRNVRFDAPACTKFETVELRTQPELAAFVDCLAALGVKHLGGADDKWVTAVFGPGMPLVLSGPNGQKITSIYGYQTKSRDIITIEPVTFTSHIARFSREVVPQAAIKKAIDASSTDAANASVVVCVDTAGKVESLATPDASTPPGYAEDVQKAANAWAIAPFELAGKRMRACAKLAVGYPASRIAAPLQMQSPVGPGTVPPTVLEGSRIAGNKVIVPDDKTKTAIQGSASQKVVGSFKLCIDDQGAVDSVSQLRSTGHPAYDAKIIAEMNTWAYRPFKVNGRAVPVCTAVTFIYSTK